MLTLPFIGMGHFYTRGEPREALVAMAMLDQGNFILPFFQGEFAFKPPMLHWLVALFSMPQGYVSEMTARLPSALAYIAMCYGFFLFVVACGGVHIGMIFFSSLAICFFYLIFGGVFTYAEDFVIISFFCHITITPWRRRRRCL